jgi:hypothetical protein
VQAAYAAYLDAWIDVANLPGVSERSAAQVAAAQEAKYRLYEADKPTTRPGTPPTGRHAWSCTATATLMS